MCADAVHVGALRVRGPDRAAALRMVPEIEDALATTSWPHGAGAGSTLRGVSDARHLQIRHLKLPPLRARGSRFAIARLIEAQIASGALHVVQTASELPPSDAAAILWPSRVHHILRSLQSVAAHPDSPPWWVVQDPATRKPFTSPEGLLRVIAKTSEQLGQQVLPVLLLRAVQVLEAQVARQWLGPVVRDVAARDSTVAPLAYSVFAAAKSPNQIIKSQVARSEVALQSKRIGNLIVDLCQNGPPVLRGTQAWLETVLAAFNHDPVAQVWVIRALWSAAAPSLPKARLEAHLVTAAKRADGNRVLSMTEVSDRRVTRARVLPASKITEVKAARHMEEAVPVKPKAATAPDDAPSEFQDTLGIPVAQAMSTDIATWLGGIVALINMLQHLGLPECDAQSDTEWTVEILHRFCQRLAPEDALLPNLPQRALRHPETVSTFVPQLQHAAVGRPFELCRISDAPGHRALMWPGGRGVVACLDASALRRLRAKNVPMTPRHKQIVTNDLPDLMQTGLCLLVQRTLRVFLERPWRHCLRRPACAVTTETHLDVTLDLDDVRLPERRVGLDRSPGWVPWLGRVVTLHFERFDKPGGLHE